MKQQFLDKIYAISIELSYTEWLPLQNKKQIDRQTVRGWWGGGGGEGGEGVLCTEVSNTAHARML